MQMTNNTILVTGGGSGIGRALAEAFHALGNKVIIAGRRQSVLDAVTAANPGMAALQLDVESPDAIRAFVEKATREFPTLNVLINNAGTMKVEMLKAQQADLADAETIININLLGPIRLTAALMPQLLAQPKATIINVTSGLAFLPLAITPTYSATKAALHSYTMSLRYQLKGSSVDVIELAPPYVQTELMGPQQANDPHAMPLAAFIEEVMDILSSSPDEPEILVQKVHELRYAERGADVYGHFNKFNDAMSAALAH
jgi:uncharacterized oxidoreductase